MENRQNRLSRWAWHWNIADQSQPNLLIRPDGPPCKAGEWRQQAGHCTSPPVSPPTGIQRHLRNHGDTNFPLKECGANDTKSHFKFQLLSTFEISTYVVTWTFHFPPYFSTYWVGKKWKVLRPAEYLISVSDLLWVYVGPSVAVASQKWFTRKLYSNVPSPLYYTGLMVAF